MRPVAPVAAVLALVLVPSLGAAAGVTHEFTFEMRDDGFHVSPDESPNPMVHVEPGARVVIHVQNAASTPQNLQLGAPLNVSTSYAQRPGEAEDLVFDTPADFQGDVEYYSHADPTRFHGVLRIGKVYPSVRIVELRPNAQVGETLTVTAAVDHFTLEPYPFDTRNAEGRGHIQWLLDGKNASGPTDLTTWTFTGLSEGAHLILVQLLQHDATPVDPRATDERVVFHQRGAPTVETPTPAPAPANDALFMGSVALGLVASATALVLSASRRRRPR